LQLRSALPDLDINDEGQDKPGVKAMKNKYIFHAGCLKRELEALHTVAIAKLSKTKPLISVTYEDKVMEIA